jgi:hypothetical protein
MTVWVVSLEPIEQRYTGEWQRHLPDQIRSAARERGSDERVDVIAGSDMAAGTSPGAFLDFAGTNVFKAGQIETIAKAFQSGDVKRGDRFLFTDAWHYGVIAVRYMSDLLEVPVKLVGLFHAGSYDPHDFLGRINDRRWASDFERSLFHALDASCFATDFHIDMFKSGLGIDDDSRILRCGWPMEYLPTVLEPHRGRQKRKLVLFPHRLAPEKQVDIFRDLATEFPGYEFRVCQDTQLTKAEYHRLLGEALLVFSANLQETLGIGLYEGMLCGVRPFAPDRLSYREMYPQEYLYPSEWTESFAVYRAHKAELVRSLADALVAAERMPSRTACVEAAQEIAARFFNGADLYRTVLR